MFPFGALAEVGKLRELARAIRAERFEVEKDGVRVVVNGEFQVEDIHIDPTLPLARQEALLKECVNAAIKKAQMEVAKRMAALR